MTTLNLQVLASEDDAYEAFDGTGFNRTSATLFISPDSSDESDRFSAGMRHASIPIPNSSNIDSATLTVNRITGSTTASVRVYGEDIDDAPSFSASEDVTGRDRTTAFVSWIVPKTSGWYSPSDIAAIIQEIVDRPGWVTNNGLVVFVDGQTDDDGDGEITSYDLSPGNGGKLDIDFQAGGSAGRIASSRGVMRGTRRGVM